MIFLSRVLLSLSLFLVPVVAQTPPLHTLTPSGMTDAVANDPDDPAIWVHPTDPEKCRIIGTNKVAAKDGGALCVFDMQGKTTQTIPGIDRPNNVDVEYGLSWQGKKIDIAVVTERNTSKLRVFRIDAPSGKLSELVPGGIPVFAGQTGDAAAPMGIALYKRPKDGAIFAIVGRKSGPGTGYLWQYRLREENGKLLAEKVRTFGTYSGRKEIESIAVDDELGYVYYSDERFGVRKYHADPSHPDAEKELATFATDGFSGDHEGIAIYTTGPKTGYILCTDQILKADGGSVYRVFPREGEGTNPHHHPEIARFNGGADETDGIEATSHPLGKAYPAGALVVMNSGPKNFLLFDARDLRKKLAK